MSVLNVMLPIELESTEIVHEEEAVDDVSPGVQVVSIEPAPEVLVSTVGPVNVAEVFEVIVVLCHLGKLMAVDQTPINVPELPVAKLVVGYKDDRILFAD